jgi:CheY-like chemotaxis protein
MARSHLEQLAMNLAVNARDAMPQGGKLSFSLRERILDKDGIAPLPAGRYVELAVADQGTGIPDDVLPRLFDPFFTTKGEGGTGLGLATCHSIVSQLKGNVAVETVLGKGTTFRILLPALGKVDVRSVSNMQRAQAKRVLVVDDEAAVREMTARMLRSVGFEVRSAANLAEAKQVLEARDTELDVVLTDIMLSGESGTDLVGVVHALRPKARVVVMSGYTPNPDAARVLVENGAEFLPKPFVMAQLLEAIRPAAIP